MHKRKTGNENMTRLAWWVLLVAAAAPFAFSAEEQASPETMPAPILIQFNATAANLVKDAQDPVLVLQTLLVKDLDLSEAAQLRETPLSRLLRKEQKNGTIDVSRWMLLLVNNPSGDPAQLEALAGKLRGHPFVAHAELDYGALNGPDQDAEPEAAAHAHDAPGLQPDDPWFRYQYYHHLIRTPEAWQITTGSPDVLVAVLDEGCNPKIKDLAGRIEPGYDFVNDTVVMAARDSHGTPMVSLIAAEGNNGMGIAGMDWQCRVIPVNMVDGGVAGWAQAIEFAIHAGADVINISGKLDLSAPSAILEGLLEQAARKNIIVVASAGNQNAGHLAWPASSPHVIAVGATDGRERRWEVPITGRGSNVGPGLDIVAPGESILALGSQGQRSIGDGTSPACALVAGACALMRAVNPGLTPEQTRQILRDTARKIGPPEMWRDGYSEHFGYGRLDVFEAVKAARQRALVAADGPERATP